MLRRLLLACAACLLGAPLAAAAQPLAAEFAREVDRPLHPPGAAQAAYAARLDAALRDAGAAADASPQFFLLVDRSSAVQAALLYWRSPEGAMSFVGAAPVATGRAGQFEHFTTPIGVFEHLPGHPDFRAEGTYNQNGIRGYGRAGMRVFDFGWVNAERGWGRGGFSPMRLQMHATDPDALEPLLGEAHSKGCIRIPASLDVFLDRHGVLDAEYEAKAHAGHPPPVLDAARLPTPWRGRWLIIVDSGESRRPAWSPLPAPVARPLAEAGC